MAKKKVNYVNEYGINEATNPRELARLYNKLNYAKSQERRQGKRFHSNDTNIITARSGEKTFHKVGSTMENNYFKVINTVDNKTYFFNSEDEYKFWKMESAIN